MPHYLSSPPLLSSHVTQARTKRTSTSKFHKCSNPTLKGNIYVTKTALTLTSKKGYYNNKQKNNGFLHCNIILTSSLLPKKNTHKTQTNNTNTIINSLLLFNFNSNSFFVHPVRFKDVLDDLDWRDKPEAR